MSSTNTSSLSYKDAGVDIDAGNELVSNIKNIAKRTKRAEVLEGLGGFASLFQLDVSRYKQPVIVSSTDGVGTKLKLANMLLCHDTIGIDLVAMCVNDLLVCGAEPLFFLDYFATGKLDVAIATEVIKGIGEGCMQAGAALVGGETAEMPGFYHQSEYDLAGFSVGVVEKANIINKGSVQPGDVLMGLASSGPHSNGYSLIRKIIEVAKVDLSLAFEETTLGKALLQPTRIYVKPILQLLKHHTVHGMAHITGGGFYENIPRMLPAHTKALIRKDSWTMPNIFQWLQQQGNIEEKEMYTTFNCGIGMVLCIPKEEVEAACALLKAQGETVYQIGEIAATKAEQPYVEMS